MEIAVQSLLLPPIDTSLLEKPEAMPAPFETFRSEPRVALEEKLKNRPNLLSSSFALTSLTHIVILPRSTFNHGAALDSVQAAADCDIYFFVLLHNGNIQ